MILIISGSILFILCLSIILFVMMKKKQKLMKRLNILVHSSQNEALEVMSIQTDSNSKSNLLSVLAKPLDSLSITNRQKSLLVQAGSTLSPGEYLVIRLMLVICILAVSVIYQLHWIFLVLFGIIGFYIPHLQLKRKIHKRLERCSNQLAEALGTMANSLRAGFSFMQAMKLISEEFPDPIGTEFQKTIRDISLGIPVEDAFQKMLERLPHKDLELTVKALLIQRTSGGNLSLLLETIQDTIRSRISLHDEIRTLTAQGKLSSIIITLLPFAIVSYLQLVNPDYFHVLFTHPIGWAMVFIGSFNIVLGWFFFTKNCKNRGVIMPLLFVLVPSFIFFFFIAAGILHFIYRKEFLMERRMGFINSEVQTIAMKKSKNTYPLLEDKLKPTWDILERRTAKKMSKAVRMDLEIKLREAGYPYGWNPIKFRLIQLTIGISIFLLSFLLLLITVPEEIMMILVLSFTLMFIGLYSPLFFLSVQKRKRVEQIQKDMPDFFDMVNLSIEAGLGLDAAIQKVCQQMNSPLSEEFKRTLEEMRLGKARKEAYVSLRDRIPLDSFQNAMTSIIQSDQLGLGIGKVIRQLTYHIREKQRQIAREKSMKSPIKMMFPMILFIFPAVLIVLLGPLVIQLLQGVLSF